MIGNWECGIGKNWEVGMRNAECFDWGFGILDCGFKVCCHLNSKSNKKKAG